MVTGFRLVVVDDTVGVGVRESLEETSSWPLLEPRPARRPSDCASRRDCIVCWRDWAARSTGSKRSGERGSGVVHGAGCKMLLLDAGGEPADLAEKIVVEDGGCELRRSCWGRSGIEGGNIRSRRELCMANFGTA
jgi:hypothetical protein